MVDKIKSYFGLSKMPFSKQSLTNKPYQSLEIKEISARLELAVQNEDIFLLTGSVGCGKTTASKLLVRLLDPTSGNIYIKGENIAGLKRE